MYLDIKVAFHSQVTRWLFSWQVVFGDLSVTVCVVFLQEGVASHNDNMQYVNLAVRASAQGQRGQDPRDTRPVKRDSGGQIRKNSDLVRDSVPLSVPFGPHLIPVRCQQERSPETRGVTTKDLEVKSSRNCDVKSHCSVGSDAAPRTELACAARLHQGKYERGLDLTQCRPPDCANTTSDNSSEDYEEPIHTTITTNDLLDCLVHPDIIARITKLLLERHTGSHRTTTSS